MIKITPFLPEHLQMIEPDPQHVGEDHSWILEKMHHKEFNAVTVIKDGMVIGIFGYYEIYAGCARAWAIVSTVLKHYPVFLYSNVKNTIDAALGTRMFNRVEMTTKNGYPVLTRWAKKLGFKLTSNLGGVSLYVREASWHGR